jgi:hypothetical protein
VTSDQRLVASLWNSMTPVAGISPIMFHRYDDDFGALDDVINGVGKIRYSANSNSGFDFSELGRCVPNSFNGRSTASKNRSAAFP